MVALLLALGLTFLSGLGAWLVRRSPRQASLLGAGGVVIGGVLGLFPVLKTLLGGPSLSLKLAWSIPFGSFYLHLDALSAFFLLPLFGLSVLAAIYGMGYMADWPERQRIGTSWFFFNTLVASMALVILARNGILFLISWEVMSLASYFLVTLEDEKESACSAGWTYLIATHLGTAFLFVLFVLLAQGGGSFDFDSFTPALGAVPQGASLLFLLALIGFGVKAGFVPFHVWLPEAHPAAPSHVSALMSGIMIKTGIYGLLRILTFLGTPPSWWGWLLVGVGLASGILGVLWALTQHDLKRLLAYHSVENIGIIAMGLGIGLLGVAHGLPALAALGFAGGLLHVLNHATFKGLLFLGAGAVLHATKTAAIDRLGGLLKRMPWTGVSFLIGAAAISGLPPLNGFVSEFLIYLGAARGVTALAGMTAFPMLAAIAGLALIGGLAAACFAKAFGVIFLGEPREGDLSNTHEVSWLMLLPMGFLAVLCIAIGLLAPLAFVLVNPRLLSDLIPFASAVVGEEIQIALLPLVFVSLTAMGLVALIVLIMALRRWLLEGRAVSQAVTWDCGYARPTPRMQYTASSFAQPLTALFRLLLPAERKLEPPQGFFPAGASLSIHSLDLFVAFLYGPLFSGSRRMLAKLRWLQHGRLQIYILYIALTILALLLWKL